MRILYKDVNQHSVNYLKTNLFSTIYYFVKSQESSKDKKKYKRLPKIGFVNN